MSLDTLDGNHLVKENRAIGKKGERKRFPRPQNGMEYVTEVIRSEKTKVLSVGARLTLMYLADYLGKVDRSKSDVLVVFPSVATLANNMGCSKRTVHRHLAELEKKKFIRRCHRKSDMGDWDSNDYLLKPSLV